MGGILPLMPPIAASFFCNFRHVKKLWRKRVGVEPTIRPAKDRITGFEGRESHRPLFASASSITWMWLLVVLGPDMPGAGWRLVEKLDPPAAAAPSLASIFGPSGQGELRRDGTPLRRLAECGSKRRRDRKVRDWCRLRNKHAWKGRRFFRQGAIAAPCLFAILEVPRIRRAAPRHNRE